MFKYMAKHIHTYIKSFIKMKFNKGLALKKYIINLKIPNLRKCPLHNN